MLSWLGPRKSSQTSVGHVPINHVVQGDVTDDPLAAIDPGLKARRHRQIYSVSRSVFLPRVTLKNAASSTFGGGVNPLFMDCNDNGSLPGHRKLENSFRHSSPQSGEKSSSSGYGSSQRGSSLEPPNCQEEVNFREDSGIILEQNPEFVKKISVSSRDPKNNKSVPSHSSSSGVGTLTTIPEGRVDLPVPKPIWPLENRKLFNQYDSLVDDALLLYTSFNYTPTGKLMENHLDLTVKEMLVDLLTSINSTLEGKNDISPEAMLKFVNEKIKLKLETLRNSTEEEMRKLCVNLSNCRKVNSVLKAFSNSSEHSASYSGTGRVRTISDETEDVYQVQSGSSNSDFSDSFKEPSNVLPVFVQDDLVSVQKGYRNAMIYGTLCRAKSVGLGVGLGKEKSKGNLLGSANDSKPSVWEQYYGVKAVEVEDDKYVTKPTDIPLFPGGRPEADFTLDVPRSEFLSKRMRADKKWRCRCRLLTSFLGLIFFLLSVMAVSLMLTRGKRMFGSMV